MAAEAAVFASGVENAEHASSARPQLRKLNPTTTRDALRTSPLSRRAFFAADGAAFIVQALADDAPSRVRVRALVIAADVFENPTVHVTGANSQTLATGERHLAIKGVEAFARLMRRGSRDSREKASLLFFIFVCVFVRAIRLTSCFVHRRCAR